MGSPIYMFIPITPISVLINFLNFTSVFFVLPKSRAGGGGWGDSMFIQFSIVNLRTLIAARKKMGKEGRGADVTCLYMHDICLKNIIRHAERNHGHCKATTCRI